jgi:Flp pilus assembly protein TadG
MNTNQKTIEANPMRKSISSFVRRALRDQSGQTIPFIAMAMTGLLASLGLVIDVGHAYVVQGTLQNSANAAALAASGYVYYNTNASVNATTMANGYSASAGGENIYNASTVTTYVSTKCLNSLMPKGSSCVYGGSSASAPNSVKVVQTAVVPTTFMGLLGMSKLNVSATATASMQGASLPWNIAVIIDSTGSMASNDSNCGMTQFQCALTGVQALLQDVNPCKGTATSCPDQSTANVRVSLFTFPNVLTAVNGAMPKVNGNNADSIKDEIACGGTPATWTNYANQPLAAPYTLPVPGQTMPVYTSGTAPSTYDVGLTYLRYTTGGSSPTTWDATYQITPFESDYYDAADANNLESNSNLVKAVGYGSTHGCLTYTFGIWGTGSGSGFGNTYTASAVYAAQNALNAEKATYGGQNALILLSDGGMNASFYNPSSPSGGYNKSAYGSPNSTNQYADANEFPSAPAGSEVGPNTSNNPTPSYYTPATASNTTIAYSALGGNGKGLYPDWYDQCQQTIQAGQYATNHSTTVFSVAYGASTSDGCSSSGWAVGVTDTTSLGLKDSNGNSLPAIFPCVEMEAVATNLNYFYSDYKQGSTIGSCNDSAHATVALSEIFQAIAGYFTTPRLIPNNAS